MIWAPPFIETRSTKNDLGTVIGVAEGGWLGGWSPVRYLDVFQRMEHKDALLQQVPELRTESIGSSTSRGLARVARRGRVHGNALIAL